MNNCLDLDFQIMRSLSSFERGKDGQYHYLFCTTRLAPNGRCMFFIGSHSCPDLHNDYLGDGKVLRQVLNTWGTTGCRKFILATFPTKEDAETAERSVVTQQLVDRPESYNDLTGAEMVAKRHKLLE